MNYVDIRILQEAFANAETITIYISTTEFTTADIENGNIDSITFNATILDEITPGMINRYKFTGLINGTYYVAVSYSNPLGRAVSNVLEITVEMDESKGNNSDDPFSAIDGYSGMIMASLISIIGILWISSRKRRNLGH